MAVSIAYGSLLGGFTGKFTAVKAVLDASGVSAVADFAELVFASYAADFAVWAGMFLHFGAFLAGDSADTDFHSGSTIHRGLLRL